MNLQVIMMKIADKAEVPISDLNFSTTYYDEENITFFRHLFYKGTNIPVTYNPSLPIDSFINEVASFISTLKGE